MGTTVLMANVICIQFLSAKIVKEDCRVREVPNDFTEIKLRVKIRMSHNFLLQIVM